MRPVTTTQNAKFDVQPSSNFSEPPCSAASFEVNSEPHTGARPSVRLCVGLINPLISCRIGLGAFVAAFFIVVFFPFALLVQGGLDPSKISGVGADFVLLVRVLPGPNTVNNAKRI
jgi:hypothetical protein